MILHQAILVVPGRHIIEELADLRRIAVGEEDRGLQAMVCEDYGSVGCIPTGVLCVGRVEIGQSVGAPIAVFLEQRSQGLRGDHITHRSLSSFASSP
jgi:hypothetical protein